MKIINMTVQEHPILVDKYLMGREVEVDGVFDGEDVLIPGIMEHVERAGIHSGDSIAVYPPLHIDEIHKETILKHTRNLAKHLGVIGLINVQFIIYNDTVYIIEANPRSSRTIPYISKVTNVPIIDLATKVMLGAKLKDLGYGTGIYPEADYFACKMPVFSFEKLTDVDINLGPEMKSTGEVMGIAKSYPEAYAKTQLAIDYKLPDPSAGKVFISVCDRDKRHILSVARILRYLGFDICSTEGTARVLRGGNVTCEVVEKISGPHDGERPNIGDLIADGKIAVIVNTPYGPGSRGDGYLLRTEAVRRGVTCVTAMSAANTYVSAIEAVREDQQGHGSANDMGMDVIALQDLPQYTV